MPNHSPMRVARWLTILFAALAGVYLVAGGIWLTSLGGSPYYIVAGIVFLAVAFLTQRQSGWTLVLFALLLAGVWGVGNAMLITLASMQGVPTELYEAAQVDGAGGWRQFRNITLPMITPVIFYNLVLSVIALMQYFTTAYVMTGAGTTNGNPGDPNKAALFLNLYFYKTAFTYLNMGYGAAQAWLIFIIGLIATGILFATARFWVYYASGD